ncbi:MAG: DUF4380 domain-containing protein [Chloroflexota bacterium]|nr:DUF4380 domain-containing protein [Chloroflexota bacterium]
MQDNQRNHQKAEWGNKTIIEEADFCGWKAVYLRNDLVTLVAVPDIGGRIMAYDLGDYPFLFVDPNLAGKLFSPDENAGDGSLAAWKNYGGDKTWPSPQGWDNENQWHGPPDPVLDTGRYSLVNFGSTGREAFIEMTSPPDLRTGIQITRKATIYSGSTRVVLDLIFKNISDRAVRWSIWDVVQLRSDKELADGTRTFEPECVVTTPLNKNSRFPNSYNVMFGEERNPQWQINSEEGLFVAQYQWEIGKVGIDSSAGWIAFSNNASGFVFAEQFTHFSGAEYPDEGVSVECWTVGKGVAANLDYEHSGIYLMETEVLSPLFDIQPGESRSFRIEWGVCRCPGPVLDVQAGGCIGRRLNISDESGKTKLNGAFGVFEPGELILNWEAAGGTPLKQESIGRVSPLEAVILDEQVERVDRAIKIKLTVKAEVDGSFRDLAEIDI